MTNTTVIVSIGSALPPPNYGPKELGERQFTQFIDRTTAIVLSACNRFEDIHFTGRGQGRYEGQIEESFTIIATIDEALVVELKARLSVLAHIYGQDSVAVTTGTTDIVAAQRSRS